MSYPLTRQWFSTPTRKSARLLLVLITIVGLCFLPLLARGWARVKTPNRSSIHNEPGIARLSDVVSVHAAGRGNPTINLSDGHDLVTAYNGPDELRGALDQNLAQPRSLASADFDEDGVPDLVSGYAYNGQGIVTLLRGNVDSIYPNAPEAQQRKAEGTFTNAPFLSPANIFAAPVAADFIGAGDFDGDSHWDVVVASRAHSALHLLSGDGHGQFRLSKEVALPGNVTAFTAGEINRRDGLTDLVVGIDGATAKVLVFEGPKGALSSTPDEFDLSEPATGLGLGFLDEQYEADLAVAAGKELLIVSGRDRKLSLAEAFPVNVGPANLERIAFDSAIGSLAIGDFVGDSRSDIAVLTRDGRVLAGSRRKQAGRSNRQNERHTVWSFSPLGSNVGSTTAELVGAEISSNLKTDLLLVDALGNRVEVLTNALLSRDSEDSKEIQSLFAVDAPVALLPLRLNVDGLNDIVILRNGIARPSLVLTAATSEASGELPNQPAVTAFSNSSPIVVNGFAISPYPSTINVSGMTGTIDKVRVRLLNLSLDSSYTADVLDVLLVGPAGQKLMLLSDAGTCCTFTFDDSASSFLNSQSGSGTYKPTNIDDGSDSFPGPAPAGPYASTLATFNGTSANGTWNLYVAQDRSSSVTGSLAGGWTLYFGPDGAPTTRVVTNTNDSGAGSLRQAMLDANASFGPDTITFSIGSGLQTITPGSPLPIITETVTIDATTQPGFGGQPIIQLNMSQAGNDVGAFFVRADSTVVRGFVINGVGVGSTFTAGIDIRSGRQNIVEGNYIGSNPSGTVEMSESGSYGVAIYSSDNTVGGTTAAARNLLSGVDIGVTLGTASFFSPPEGNNRVQGNFFCTNAAGTESLNTPFFLSIYGVEIETSFNNTIGGTIAGSRNLISGCGFSGIELNQPGTTGNLIQGNFIGTDISGALPVRSFDGVDITTGAASNTVGGSTVAARNIISGNTIGVAIGQSGTINSTPSNTIQGNYIGTDVTGTASLTNGRAVQVPANVVGSQVSSNRIAFNRFVGVELDEDGSNDAPGIRVAIFDNEIYANGGLGIDLGPTGITPNDQGDPDGGANLRQNFPVLTSSEPALPSEVQGSAGTSEPVPAAPDPLTTDALKINGTLNSTPNSTFTVHWYFSNDTQCVANQASSQPLVFDRVPNVTTDSSGNASFNFNFTFPPGITSGIINCTATDSEGNTSEFSSCFAISGGPPPTPSPSPTPTPTPAACTNTFSNPANIVINDTDAPPTIAAPYPASINVAGLSGTIAKLTLSLNGLNHTFPDDVDVLLVGPQGQSLIVLSDVGSGSDCNAALIFDDSASSLPPDNGPLVSGTFRPSNVGGSDGFPLPAPASSNSAAPAGAATLASVFNGTNPNGTWSLYVVDDEGLDTGSISGGWSLTVTTSPCASTVQFDASSYSAAENIGSRSVTVQRSGDTSGLALVNYTTSDTAGANNCSLLNTGKASSRCDYETTAGTLKFAAGQTSKIISIPIVDDVYAEGGESFSVTLSNASGASLGSPSLATVNITDNDSTTGTNPITLAPFFVRLHYVDFFTREPDSGGMAFWSDQITSCGTNQACIDLRRINVSAAFYLSIEFQDTGYLVYRFYKASYGNIAGLPVPVRFNEFLPDTQQIGQGVIIGQPGADQLLENNKVAFAADFIARSRFTTAYPTSRTPAQFVDALFANAAVTPAASDRTSAINEFGSATNTTDTAARARALRRVAENAILKQQETNKAFVLMQYFGYLRRNPDDPPEVGLDFGGYNFWLGKLNQFNGNFVNAEMVKAFIVSGEYKQRFGP